MMTSLSCARRHYHDDCGETWAEFKTFIMIITSLHEQGEYSAVDTWNRSIQTTSQDTLRPVFEIKIRLQCSPYFVYSINFVALFRKFILRSVAFMTSSWLERIFIMFWYLQSWLCPFITILRE